LLIRADADAVIGTGHIMRCLALAHAWQENGGQVVFVTTCQSHLLLEKIRAAGIGVVQFGARHPAAEDLAVTLDIAKKHEVQWLVLDGYHFDPDYQCSLLTLESRGCWLLVIDDYGHWPEYHAHLVLNQNLIFPQPEILGKYRLEDQGVTLSGPGYALLRKSFKEAAGRERKHPERARNILVTLGGADPDNQSGKILAALDQLTMPLAVKIIVGAANPWRENLSGMAAANRHRVEILQDVSDIETHMLWADLAISAGGSTCWELCCLGTPNLILTIADNQWIIANGLSRYGASLPLGWYADKDAGQISRQVESLIVDPGLRRRMSAKGKELVAGDGAAKVVSVLQEWSGKQKR
jgi:UDP-2,4-diacetamido-2,4,6-trideoxy-beta-L-altropyranose hydrolase